MNIENITERLRGQYLGKQIIEGDGEIICEVEPTSNHPEYSAAVAVIDQSIEHFHRVTTEEYEVLEGEFELTVAGEKHILKQGDCYTIKPTQPHSAKGAATWVRVTSHPGWTAEDYIITE